MKLSRYPVHQLNDFTYQFFSQGPRGDFEMRVIFSREFYEARHDLYNLAFGCWDFDKEDIDDQVELRNKDADKVLSTVAHIALHFLRQNSTAFIFAQGSTPSRTRKYQMGISRYIKEAPSYLRIEGLVQDDGSQIKPHWARFESGINYKAFIFYKGV